MANLNFILLCFSATLLLLLFSSSGEVFSHHTSPTTPTWLPRNEVVWSELLLFSGGISSLSTPTFVARAKVEDGVVIGGVSGPGRAGVLYYNKYNSGGEIGFSSRFELLVYPRGSLIWVEVATPQNVSGCSNRDAWFSGGNQPGSIISSSSSSTLYVCRGWHANEVAIGQLRLGNGTGGCEVVAEDGRSSSTLERFEILILNNLLESSCSSYVKPVTKLDGLGHDNPAAFRWIPSDLVNRSELSQAGVEYGWPFYIGRVVTHSGATLVGKAKLYSNSNNEFTYMFNGKEHSTTKFDFLVAPPGVLSWVAVVTVTSQNHNRSCIPQNAFVGGEHSVEGISYVCRVWWTSSRDSLHRLLVIGRVRREGAICEIGIGEALHYNEFDILIVNDDEESSCPTPPKFQSSETPITSTSNGERFLTGWILMVGVLLLLLLVVGIIGGCVVVRFFFGGWKTGGSYQVCTRRCQSSGGDGL